MPYYVICPYYVSDRYPTKKEEAAARKHPEEDSKIMTCCECARIVPPSKKSRAFLYEHFCTTQEWKKCSIAQLLNEYYDEQEKNHENKRIEPISNNKAQQGGIHDKNKGRGN